MKKVSTSEYKKRLAAWKKAEKEQAETQKVVWNRWIEDLDANKALSPIEKAEAWLHQIMIKGKSIIDSGDWNAQLTVDEFVDQEALIYFVSRGVDCREQIKNMTSRLKEQKKKSEAFVKTVESWSDKELRFMGFRKKKKNPRKSNEIPSPEEAMWRNTIPLTDDNQPHNLVSTYRIIEWCDIGGFDEMWESHAERLREDVARGGEIKSELACQFLFNICRSDFAIEIFEEDLLKLLSIVEAPDYQLTIPWHRWNRDDMSLLAGVKSNSIFAYAASIAFSNGRIRKEKTNKEVVNQALKWLLESQEKNGSWKFSTVLDEPSILATCMVVHALGLSRPRGWKSSAALACEWLLSKQDSFGFWFESTSLDIDPVYLTVLVLDTLELAAESPKLTFHVNK
ncbi:MAG TPA: hypothetical protein VFQ23_21990, partial [Anaerolineales bacterium]|nr:hypothetical protein [Anaerolineales bacterium]